MSHDHAAHGHGGHTARAATPTPATATAAHPRATRNPAPAADENRRGREGETLHYALYTVFARSGARPAEQHRRGLRAEFEKVVEQPAAEGVTLRGIYDVSATRQRRRHDFGPTAQLPKSCRRSPQDPLHRTLRRHHHSLSTMGVHREAEFTRNHAPAYARGKAPETGFALTPYAPTTGTT